MGIITWYKFYVLAFSLFLLCYFFLLIFFCDRNILTCHCCCPFSFGDSVVVNSMFIIVPILYVRTHARMCVYVGEGVLIPLSLWAQY